MRFHTQAVSLWEQRSNDGQGAPSCRGWQMKLQSCDPRHSAAGKAFKWAVSFAVICQAIKFRSGTQLDGRAEKTQCDGCGSVSRRQKLRSIQDHRFYNNLRPLKTAEPTLGRA